MTLDTDYQRHCVGALELAFDKLRLGAEGEGDPVNAPGFYKRAVRQEEFGYGG